MTIKPADNVDAREEKELHFEVLPQALDDHVEVLPQAPINLAYDRQVVAPPNEQQLHIQFQRLPDDENAQPDEKILCFRSRETAAATFAGSLGGIGAIAICQTWAYTYANIVNPTPSTFFAGLAILSVLDLAGMLMIKRALTSSFFPEDSASKYIMTMSACGFALATLSTWLTVSAAGGTEVQADVISTLTTTAVALAPAVGYGISRCARNPASLFGRIRARFTTPVQPEHNLAPAVIHAP